MRTKNLRIELLDEEVVARTAKILGPSSAAQLALDDAKARRERGEEVVLARHGATILVVPAAAIVQNPL